MSARRARKVFDAGDATVIEFAVFNRGAATTAAGTTAATAEAVDFRNSAGHRVAVVGIDEDLAGVVFGDVDLRAGRFRDAADRLAEDDSGKVFVYSNNAEAMNRAIAEIDGLCGGGGGPGGGGGGAPIETGKLYLGRITGIKDFGCFVECTPGKEGLVHISELADFRVRRTEDVVKMGEMIWVKCVGIDERSGKVRLSRKAAMKEMEGQKQGGEAAPAAAPAAQ